MANSTWLQYFPYRTNLSHRETDTCEKGRRLHSFNSWRDNQTPFFVFIKIWNRLVALCMSTESWTLSQKTCVHLHKLLVQYRTSKYEAIKNKTQWFRLKWVLRYKQFDSLVYWWTLYRCPHWTVTVPEGFIKNCGWRKLKLKLEIAVGNLMYTIKLYCNIINLCGNLLCFIIVTIIVMLYIHTKI